MRFILIFITLMLYTPLTYSAKLYLRVEGLKGELATNVEERLKVVKSRQMSDTPQLRRQVVRQVKMALRALGYYQPKVRFFIKQGVLRTILLTKINPGKPILIETVDINIEGEGSSDLLFTSLIQNESPKRGDVLNHGIYDSFKKKLQDIALRQGYFDSEISQSRLGVSEKLRQAFLSINFKTGKRYRLGEVIFNEIPIKESYLRQFIPFKQGDQYSAEAIGLFSSRLSSSNWFNTVTVIPEISKANKQKELPVYVTAVPRKKNLFDVGLGYSTDIGTHGKLGWTRPWINSRGHSIQSNISLSKVERLLTSSYKIPLAKSPLEHYYTVQSGYKHENNNDTYSDAYTLGIIRHWDSFSNWQHAIGLNTSYNSFTQADNSYNTFLIYPSFNLYRVRQRGGVFPMWGDSQRYSLEFASHDMGSDITFLRFTLQQVWIRSLHNKHRFIAKGNFGFIDTGKFERVPPSFRYFAGGDRSIRGYSYKSISPKDSNGKLLGASRLLTGTLEYQYRFTQRWWGATFIDSGEAVNSFKDQDFHTGVGIGVRWVSPIGAIKLDIAKPIREKEKDAIHFYIGIGTEL